MRCLRCLLLASFLLLLPVWTWAQEPAKAKEPEKAAPVVTAEDRAAALKRIGELLTKNYVFPDKGEAMAKLLADLQTQKAYDSLTDGEALAKQLTEDLRGICKDKHLRVIYEGGNRPGPAAPQLATPGTRQEMEKAANYGFERLERLPGNIGYIELRSFTQGKEAAERVRMAFEFLANTDALIFDLRRNGGGSPEQIRQICSYLVGPEPVHLNSIYHRAENRTEEFWTLKEVPGPRYLNKPVFVVTSAFTFSGAEEFSYNLKNLKRATIVGENTGGGAHPVRLMRAGQFSISVPFARSINPISKTNWEGVGVAPDVACHQDEALERAVTLAVEALKNSPDEKVKRRVTAELGREERMKTRMKELREQNLKDQAEANKGT